MDTPTPDNAASATPVSPLTYGLRRKGETAVVGIIPPKIHEMPAKAEWFEREYEEIPLYDAATVAALEAEVGRRKSAQAALSTYASAAEARAEAAERRASALQACSLKYLNWLHATDPEADLERDLHDAEMCGDQALTGARAK